MEKEFERWIVLKQKLDAITRPPFFNEREIWWCSIGTNVGSEVYGKGRLFTRPVLILKKQSGSSFMGIPMSTQLKPRTDYHLILFKGKQSALMLSELRKFDSRRLSDKLGKISEGKFLEIQDAVLKNFQPR